MSTESNDAKSAATEGGGLLLEKIPEKHRPIVAEFEFPKPLKTGMPPTNPKSMMKMPGKSRVEGHTIISDYHLAGVDKTALWHAFMGAGRLAWDPESKAMGMISGDPLGESKWNVISTNTGSESKATYEALKVDRENYYVNGIFSLNKSTVFDITLEIKDDPKGGAPIAVQTMKFVKMPLVMKVAWPILKRLIVNSSVERKSIRRYFDYGIPSAPHKAGGIIAAMMPSVVRKWFNKNSSKADGDADAWLTKEMLYDACPNFSRYTEEELKILRSVEMSLDADLVEEESKAGDGTTKEVEAELAKVSLDDESPATSPPSTTTTAPAAMKA